MEDEYTISSGFKLLYCSLAAMFLLLAVWAADKCTPNQSEAFLLIPLLLIALATILFLNALRRKVLISDDSIRVINLFTTKQLDFKNIKGCRIEQKHITIEPVSVAYPVIKIVAYNDFSNSSEMAATISKRFTDLDRQDLENGRKHFLEDSSLGATEADREAKLTSAKTTAIIYALGGWGAFLLALFSDATIIQVIAMVYPLLGILLMCYSRGVIKFFTNIKTSVYPNIFFGFMPAVIAVGVRGMEAYTAIDSSNLWLPSITLSVIMFAAIYFADKIRVKEQVNGKPILILILSVILSFGLTWNSNCCFDQSPPQVYRTTVLDHHISYGKHTSYYITLAPWGPVKKETEIDAGKGMYDNTPIGDTVKVKLRRGLFHIPWYVVTKH